MTQYDVVRAVRELGGEARAHQIVERCGGRTGSYVYLQKALKKGWLSRRSVAVGKTVAVYFSVTENAP